VKNVPPNAQNFILRSIERGVSRRASAGATFAINRQLTARPLLAGLGVICS
jgi:hypothetical protein